MMRRGPYIVAFTRTNCHEGQRSWDLAHILFSMSNMDVLQSGLFQGKLPGRKVRLTSRPRYCECIESARCWGIGLPFRRR